MNADPEEAPIESERATWPPPLASRVDRRACAKRRHESRIKGGYCDLCGTQVAS